jgi:hypothetical protein
VILYIRNIDLCNCILFSFENLQETKMENVTDLVIEPKQNFTVDLEQYNMLIRELDIPKVFLDMVTCLVLLFVVITALIMKCLKLRRRDEALPPPSALEPPPAVPPTPMLRQPPVVVEMMPPPPASMRHLRSVTFDD